MLITCFDEQLLAMLLDLPGQVILRQTFGWPIVELGVRLEGELIIRDMRRRQTAQLHDVPDCASQVLPGQGKHEINVDAVETGCAGIIKGRDNIPRPMNTSQCL